MGLIGICGLELMTGKKKALLKSKKADGKGWGSEIDFIFVRREREREREKVDKNEGILRIIERERERVPKRNGAQ